MKHRISRLPGGLTVVEVPSHEVESVVVTFLVKTGSRFERKNEHGISHFLEHFLFKGTKQYPSSLAISEVVDCIGGEMNAYTTKEYTVYYIKAASMHAELLLSILSDMLLDPLLNADELEREKGVILEEMNMYKDNPQAHVSDILDKAFWPSQPLGLEIIGTPQSVNGFSRAMLAGYMRRQYVPGNIVVGFGGLYDSKKLLRQLASRWGKLPRGKVSQPKPAQIKRKQPVVTGEFRQTEQTQVVLGFLSFAYGDPRSFALSVLCAVLGGGMSSRLFMEVREKRGLAYSVRVGQTAYTDTGMFGVSAGLPVAKAHEAVGVVLSELVRAREELITTAELNKAKAYLKGKTILGLEDNQSKLDWYMEQAAFKKHILTPHQAFAAIDRVTAQDVRKVAQQVISIEKSVMAVIGPHNELQKFNQILK